MRLKELRNANDLSQKELAEKLGYKQGTISQWEMGRRMLDVETLERIADFFGVSTDYILERPATVEVLPNPLQNKLLKSFNNLNDFGKREAINRVNELSQLPQYASAQMPIAAHTEIEITDNELKLMQQDIDDL